MFPKTDYTITIKTLLDNNIDLGLKDYPIWNEDYRKTLNKKILDHYMFREIGFETPGMFINRLNTRMCEIMPYYCELYTTTQFEYNPIYNADYTSEYTKTNKNISQGTGKTTGESTTSSNSETNTKNKSAHVDTPQDEITVPSIDELTIGTSMDLGSSSGTDKSSGTSSDSSSVSSSSTSDDTEVFSQKLQGNYGVKSTQAMIQEERDLILNIDMQIISELANLFMCIW